MPTLRATVVAATALALAAAAAPSQAIMVGALPDTPAAHVDANQGGTPYSGAVSVRVNGVPFSGVVVAPQYVLTAAHVVGANLPATLAVQVNVDGAPQVHAVTAVQRFASASFPYDDLALLTLERPVDPAVVVPAILRSTVPAGTALTLVGYGASGAGDVGPTAPASPNVKRWGRNAVDAVQPTVDASGRRSLFFLFDFDGPAGNGSFGGPGLGNGLEAGLAGGDSGSPAFAVVNGSVWLVGIHNLVAPPPGLTTVNYRFGSICGGMLLSDPRFIAWLESATQGTLGLQPAREAEAPMPPWAAAVLAMGLLAKAARRRASRPALSA